MNKNSTVPRCGDVFRMKLHTLTLLRGFLMLGCAVAALTASTSWGGVLTRVANTTLKMPANPPTVGYTHKNAFGSLTFDNPIAIVTPPGETNRVFILQKNGVIMVITNLASPTKTTFMDISSKVTFSDSNTGGSGE